MFEESEPEYDHAAWQYDTAIAEELDARLAGSLENQINAWRRKTVAEIAEHDKALAKQQSDPMWGMF